MRNNMLLCKLKVTASLTFTSLGGIQELLHGQQNNAALRASLSADNIPHFFELHSTFQGHFPCLHMASFDFTGAYDGLILANMSIGSVYSDRVLQFQVRGLMQRATTLIEQTLPAFEEAANGDDFGRLQPRLPATSMCLQEVQPIFLCSTFSPGMAALQSELPFEARAEDHFGFLKRYQLLETVGHEGKGYSCLHAWQSGGKMASPGGMEKYGSIKNED